MPPAPPLLDRKRPHLLLVDPPADWAASLAADLPAARIWVSDAALQRLASPHSARARRLALARASAGWPARAFDDAVTQTGCAPVVVLGTPAAFGRGATTGWGAQLEEAASELRGWAVTLGDWAAARRSRDCTDENVWRPALLVLLPNATPPTDAPPSIALSRAAWAAALQAIVEQLAQSYAQALPVRAVRLPGRVGGPEVGRALSAVALAPRFITGTTLDLVAGRSDRG